MKLLKRCIQLYYRFIYGNMDMLINITNEITKGEFHSQSYIVEKKIEIIQCYGKDILKLIILNHRAHFHHHRKKLVLKRHKKLIQNQEKIYLSNVGITISILRNFNLTEKEKKPLYNYLRKYLKNEKYTDKMVLYECIKRINV